MGAFSDYAEQNLLDHLLGTTPFTAPGTVYVALSSTAPNEDGTGVTEPGYTGYARQAATFAAAAQSTGETAEAANTGEISFGDPDADGSASHFAVYDAATGGNMLVHDSLDATVNYQAGVTDTLKFAAGALKVSLD